MFFFRRSDLNFVFISLYMRDFLFALSSRTLLSPAGISESCFLEVCDVYETSTCRHRRLCDVSPFRFPLSISLMITYPSVSCWCGRRSGWGRSPWWRAEKRRRPSGRCQVQPRRCRISVPYSLFTDARWVLDATSAPTCCCAPSVRIPPFSGPLLSKKLEIPRREREEGDDIVTLRESPTRSLARWYLCTTKVRGIRNSSGRVARARFLAPRGLRFGYMRVGMRMLRRGRSHHLFHPFLRNLSEQDFPLSFARQVSLSLSNRWSAHPSCSRHFLFLLMPVREETPRWRVTVGAQPHCERTCHVHASGRRSHLRRWLVEGVRVGGQPANRAARDRDSTLEHPRSLGHIDFNLSSFNGVMKAIRKSTIFLPFPSRVRFVKS